MDILIKAVNDFVDNNKVIWYKKRLVRVNYGGFVDKASGVGAAIINLHFNKGESYKVEFTIILCKGVAPGLDDHIAKTVYYALEYYYSFNPETLPTDINISEICDVKQNDELDNILKEIIINKDIILRK